MKTKIGILVLVLFAGFYSVNAKQRVYTTTRATSYDISDNLDLDAVSSIFADSKNLEDFEYRLNDPENRISNLDLNNDGYVDYLRVLETGSNENSLVIIQAVLEKDIYQDVATIEIERRPDGNHRIQVIGDDYIYGANYIIEPIFVRPPLIFSFFWGPRYAVWNSPYYWGYYPRWYQYYRPYPVVRYHRNVNIYIDKHITYRRIPDRSFRVNVDRNVQIHRNDYATRYPDRAFENRNRDVKNRAELIERRSNSQNNSSANRRANSQIRNENLKSTSGSNVRTRTDSETRQQTQSRPRQIQTREYDRQPAQKSAEIKTGQEAKRPQTYQRAYENRKQEPSTRERSVNKMETVKRSSAPREKSASVKSESRVRSESRQAQSAPKKAESKKESDDRGNRRR